MGTKGKKGVKKVNGGKGNNNSTTDKDPEVIVADVKVEDSAEPSTALLEAKKIFEQTKKRLSEMKADVRKFKRKVEGAPKKLTNLRERLEKTKAGTTKTPEQLLAQAKKFEEEIAKVRGEYKTLKTQADDVYFEETAILDEIAEIKKSRSKGTTANGVGTFKVSGKHRSAKSALVKALARRVWVIKYDAHGAAIAAEKEGRVVAFGDEVWTTEYEKKTADHNYGAGAIQIADALFPKVEETKTPPTKTAKAS